MNIKDALSGTVPGVGKVSLLNFGQVFALLAGMVMLALGWFYANVFANKIKTAAQGVIPGQVANSSGGSPFKVLS